MKNFKVANKLFISYAVIITMLIAGCVVSIVDLVKLGGQIQTFYNGPFTVNSSANIVNANFEGMQKSVYRSISNTNPEIIHEAMENAEDAARAIQERPCVRRCWTWQAGIRKRKRLITWKRTISL